MSGDMFRGVGFLAVVGFFALIAVAVAIIGFAIWAVYHVKVVVQ